MTSSISDFQPVFMTLEERGPAIVARLTKPNLTDEENIEQLGHEFLTLVEHYGCLKIVVDLATTRMMTSAALGKLISLHRNLHRRGGRLVLCSLKGMVLDVMVTAKLTDYFTVADTVDDAVATLSSPSGQ